MSVIKNATNHFAEKLAQGLQSIEVPEWQTIIYFKPVTTFAQEQKIVSLHGKGEMVEALIETLIIRAVDADGKKMFKSADRMILMNEVDPNIIIKIVGAMNNARDKQQEDQDLGN